MLPGLTIISEKKTPLEGFEPIGKKSVKPKMNAPYPLADYRSFLILYLSWYYLFSVTDDKQKDLL